MWTPADWSDGFTQAAPLVTKTIEECGAILAKRTAARTAGEVQQLAALTRNVRFFRGITDKVHRALCRCIRMAKLAKNELLFRQGDEGDTFYIVVKGAVALYESIGLRPAGGASTNAERGGHCTAAATPSSPKLKSTNSESRPSPSQRPRRAAPRISQFKRQLTWETRNAAVLRGERGLPTIETLDRKCVVARSHRRSR